MHQKKEDLEYVLREITNDFFIKGKKFSKGDWERYYFARYNLKLIHLNEQNDPGFAEKILGYLQKRFYNFKNRKRLRRVCQNSADIYKNLFNLSNEIPKYNSREKPIITHSKISNI